MEPADLKIRAASLDDVARLVQWACAMAWETEHKRLDPAVVDRGVRRVLKEPGRGRYLVAERLGQSAGTLMLTYEWSDWRDADWWWIQSVYVDPLHRRQGVYRALYAHVHALAATTDDVCGLRLYVETDNTVAQNTYRALGMRKAAYVIMETEIPPALASSAV